MSDEHMTRHQRQRLNRFRFDTRKECAHPGCTLKTTGYCASCRDEGYAGQRLCGGHLSAHCSRYGHIAQYDDPAKNKEAL